MLFVYRIFVYIGEMCYFCPHKNECGMYINGFHRQSVERCLQINARLRSLPIKCVEEVQKLRAQHEELRHLYPNDR